MRPSQLVLVDYRADRVYGISDTTATLHGHGHGHAAEHAGILSLGGTLGGHAFADDLRGELIVVRQGVAATVPVATPVEHIASDPSGRYVVATTGLGANSEPWSDVVTVVDLDTNTSRRFRSRIGEPGAGLVRDRVTGEPFIVLRHRSPGAIEALPLAAALRVGPHVPVLRGARTEVADDGHGDVADARTGIFATATSRGLERFAVEAGVPVPLGIVPWPVPGRAFYLRLDSEAGKALGVVRGGPANPIAWTEWTNHFVEIDLSTGRTVHASLPPGLAFRFALARNRAAVATIHPDGDQLTIFERQRPQLRIHRQLSLPDMSAPPIPGRLPWDPVGNAPAQRRAVALAPAGDTVAVTRGGDGELHLIADRSFETVTVPTPVDEGGLLFWPGGPHDGVGR